MEFIIEQATLLKALLHVYSVVEKRNTIPVLSNLLLRASKDGQLAITATDLDMQIVEAAPIKLATAGSTTLSAQLLVEIARKAPEGAEISFTTQDDRVRIKAGRAVYTLPTLPPEDFPTIPEDDMAVRFSLSASTIVTLIDKTRDAMSTDEMRHFLNGIFLHVPQAASESADAEDSKKAKKSASAEPRMLNAVATDGHRMAKLAISCPDGAADMPDVILPRKSVLAVRKLLEDADEDNGQDSDNAVEIALSSNRVRFSIGGAVLSSKLVDGNFPDYSRVIPLENDKIFKADVTLLAQGIGRVTAIAQESTRSVRLKLEEDKVTLSYQNMESGEAVEEVASSFDSQSIEVRFNARYLMDILEQMSGTVEIHLSTPSDPALLRASGDESLIYVLMPMRV